MRNENKVAVLGPEGTFTEIAARKILPGAKLIYLDTVEDVFTSILNSEADRGVVAIENSLEGSVGRTMDCLVNYDVKIVGEVVLDVEHCLASASETGDISKIVSHPHALAQCQKYQKANFPDAIIISSQSTASAMRDLKDGEAAIGVKEAAEEYGLNIIAEGIQDDMSQTRFIAIAREPGKGNKTSVIFAVKDEPGTLYNVLKVFATRNVNLTKIESRPSRKKLGEYLFFMDFESEGISQEEVEGVLNEIRPSTTFLKELGSY